MATGEAPQSRGSVERSAGSDAGANPEPRMAHHGMFEPPLGRITMPVTNLAAGDAR